MKQLLSFGLVAMLAASSAGCSKTGSQSPDPRVPGDGVTGCNDHVYNANSAWFHGQGAPAGQGQIGYGGTMKDLHAKMVHQDKYAANSDGSCATKNWTTVR